MTNENLLGQPFDHSAEKPLDQNKRLISRTGILFDGGDHRLHAIGQHAAIARFQSPVETQQSGQISQRVIANQKAAGFMPLSLAALGISGVQQVGDPIIKNGVAAELHFFVIFGPLAARGQCLPQNILFLKTVSNRPFNHLQTIGWQKGDRWPRSRAWRFVLAQSRRGNRLNDLARQTGRAGGNRILSRAGGVGCLCGSF